MPPIAPVHTYAPGSVFTSTWWVQVTRFPLIAVVLVLAAVALWPRGAEASLDDLVADLRAGDVVAVEIGADSAFGGAVLGGAANVVDLPGSDAYRVRWRTADDNRWQTFLTQTQTQTGHDDVWTWDEPHDHDAFTEFDDSDIRPFSGIDPVLDVVADELALTPEGSELYTVRFGSQPAFVLWVTLAVWLIVLGTLIHGPQPRRITKWGWFWLLFLTPYGLGFLALLALDAPWSRAASRLDPPLPHHEQRRTATGDRRLTAVQAFAVALLASLVVGAAIGTLAA